MSSLIAAVTKVMIAVLNSLHGFTGDWGLTLVLFALFVKLMTGGTTQKMLKSQRDMARIKPLLDKINKQFASDPMKRQQETMKVMQANNVGSPLGGCLLMLLQLPIMWGIFRAISSQPEQFNTAYFMWIRPGALQSLYPGTFASCLAERDLPLVIVYGVMMLLSQSTTPSQAEPSQKTMGLYMSLMFTTMVWRLKWPCALVLYWSCYQLFTILHQLYYTNHLDRQEQPVLVVPAGVSP